MISSGRSIGARPKEWLLGRLDVKTRAIFIFFIRGHRPFFLEAEIGCDVLLCLIFVLIIWPRLFLNFPSLYQKFFKLGKNVLWTQRLDWALGSVVWREWSRLILERTTIVWSRLLHESAGLDRLRCGSRWVWMQPERLLDQTCSLGRIWVFNLTNILNMWTIFRRRRQTELAPARNLSKSVTRWRCNHMRSLLRDYHLVIFMEVKLGVSLPSYDSRFPLSDLDWTSWPTISGISALSGLQKILSIAELLSNFDLIVPVFELLKSIERGLALNQLVCLTKLSVISWVSNVVVVA